MTRRRLKSTGETFFTCPYAANKQEDGCAAGGRYMEEELEHTAYHAINQFAALAEGQAVNNKRGNLGQMDALTAELTHALIKAIYIHGANRIEIEWRFKDTLREHELEL